jgi:thiol:disulfide interchange protein
MRGLSRIAVFTGAACLCLTAACGATSSPPASGAGVNAQPAVAGSSQGASSSDGSALPDGYDPSRDASADIAAALKLASADHKKVLIDFGADWCPDCQVLGKTFHSSKVRPELDKDYHVVAVDVGKFDHNLDVASQYINLETSGIPGLVVLKPDGTVSVATNDGSFSNARTMTAAQVLDFLNQWAS